MASSLGGTWGEDRRRVLCPQKADFTTTYSTKFGMAPILDAKEKSGHSHSKFRQMQQNSIMICQYNDKNAHSSAQQSVGGGLEEGSVSSALSMSSSGSSSIRQAQGEPSRALNENLAMLRTQNKMMRTAMAPIAVGRSGDRLEKGISASGLLGERLGPGSFVQRSWLPYDDPALLYKVNGVPVAFMPNDVSIDLSGSSSHVEVGWGHGRKGNQFPSTIFSDDPQRPVIT